MNLTGPEKEYNTQEFKGLTLQQEHFEHKLFSGCIFEKCSFHESMFLQCKFQECKFQKCDLSLITLRKCSFKSTQFENSQIVGVNWVDTNLAQMKTVFTKPIDLTGCVLNHSTFMGLNLRNVMITKCIAKGVSFEEADLSHANCTHTDFADSRFLHTNLTETDFSGATNYSIAANSNILHKTIFSMPEALSLLHGLDIVLKE